jgi:3-methylcrotonyl-CoA carboxylase alpha subunit
MGYDFALGDESYTIHPVHQAGGAHLRVEGRTLQARLVPGLARGEVYLEIDGRRERLFMATDGDVHFIFWRGRTHRVEAINALERARRAGVSAEGTAVLRAPMPGTVVDVSTRVGEDVVAGAVLMTIESMKLQTAITSPADARVAEIFVSAGATFDQGAELVRLESPDEDGKVGPEESAQEEEPA